MTLVQTQGKSESNNIDRLFQHANCEKTTLALLEHTLGPKWISESSTTNQTTNKTQKYELGCRQSCKESHA